MYRCNLIYNGIDGGHNTYIWSMIMIWKQDEKNLIKPNQFRAFGKPIYDDPTNQHTPLGIEANFNTHIQMLMVGYTFGFITRYPKYDDIDTC